MRNMPAQNEYYDAQFYAATEADKQTVRGVIMMDGGDFYKREKGLWTALDEEDMLYDTQLHRIEYSPGVVSFDEGTNTLDKLRMITLD